MARWPWAGKSNVWTGSFRGRLSAVRSYGQFCPIARAAEIFAERWTPIIVRNLLMGCRTFNEIARGAPGIPRSTLSQRLKYLEAQGVVERRPGGAGRGGEYALTGAGQELAKVCEALGAWGARWLEIGPEHLDPGVALWSLCNRLDGPKLPRRRVVVRFDFRDLPGDRFWLLLEERRGEVCRTYPGFAEDLVVTADSEWLVRWHMGRVSWSQALRSRHIRVDGPAALARAFPTWNRLSPFAGVRPARPAPAVAGGRDG
jgi:DNA-binding HxlR family transcriptional regulator